MIGHSALSVVSGLATYLILTGLTPIVPRTDVVLTALVINALLVVAMVAMIAIQMVSGWAETPDKTDRSFRRAAAVFVMFRSEEMTSSQPRVFNPQSGLTQRFSMGKTAAAVRRRVSISAAPGTRGE